MSEITIIRDTGAVGSVQKVAVYLNGELVDKLSLKESKTFYFEGETAELQVGQSFMKSKKMTIAAGEKVRIKASGLRAIFGFLSMILGLPYLLLEVEE